MSIISAYQQVGTYRCAAAIRGTTHKTAKRVVERAETGGQAPARAPRPANYEGVRELVGQAVKDSKGRISAKRLLPTARAAGYAGSDRNFRRRVAAKQAWRRQHPDGRRPEVWAPGEHLVIDWGVQQGVHGFCAVLAWSQWRFVRLAADEKAATTLGCWPSASRLSAGCPRSCWPDSHMQPSRRAPSRTTEASPVVTGRTRRSTVHRACVRKVAKGPEKPVDMGAGQTR